MKLSSFWEKLKAWCLNSLTMAWSYILALIGSVMQFMDSIADALNDPTLKQQITGAIGDPKTIGKIMLGISIITMITRARSLIRKQE